MIPAIPADGFLGIYFYISKKFLRDERDTVDMFTDDTISEFDWTGNEGGS